MKRPKLKLKEKIKRLCTLGAAIGLLSFAGLSSYGARTSSAYFPFMQPKIVEVRKVKKSPMASYSSLPMILSHPCSIVGFDSYEFGIEYYSKVVPFTDKNPPGTVEKIQIISKELVKGKEAAGKKEKYAIILNSCIEPAFPLFDESVRLAFETLRKNGFSEENIIVLNGDDENKGLSIDSQKKIILLNRGSKIKRGGENKNPNAEITDYAATYENLQKATHDIAEKIDGNDLFFMCVTNHGLRDVLYKSYPCYLKGYSRESIKGESIIPLKYGCKKSINESELEEMLKDITKNSQYSVILMDQCFSGGFAERLGKDKVIAIASCKEDKISWAWWLGMSFSTLVLDALKDPPVNSGIYPQNAGNAADSNKDGKVSIEEAFDYAAKRDFATQGWNPKERQTPQLRYGNVDPTKTFLSDDIESGNQ